MDYGLRITDYRLRITDHGLQITDYGLRITDYGLQISVKPLGEISSMVVEPGLASTLFTSTSSLCTCIFYSLVTVVFALCIALLYFAQDIFMKTSNCIICDMLEGTTWYTDFLLFLRLATFDFYQGLITFLFKRYYSNGKH